MEPFGSPVSEAYSHLSGSCIVCFISLFCLNFCNRALWMCDPLSYDPMWSRWATKVFLSILDIYCKALSLGFSQFLGETLSVLPQDLRVLWRCVNIPDLGYSDGWNPMWGCHLQLLKGLIQCQVRYKPLDEEMLCGSISLRWTIMRWTLQWVLMYGDNN